MSALTKDDLRAFGEAMEEIGAIRQRMEDITAQRDEALARVLRLEETIRTVLADEESQPGGWGPDVTMVAVLRAALFGDKP